MVALSNSEYERIVLSELLQRPESIDYVSQYLDADSFYDELHKKVYKAITELIAENVEVTLLTVSERIGRYAEVSAITSSIGSIEHYTKLVRDLAIRRAVVRIDEELKRKAHDVSEPIETLVEKAETEISHLLDVKSKGFQHIGSFVHPALEQIEERYNTGGINGIATGYHPIDFMLGGFQRGDLIIIGARTSIGKTALALNFAENMAIKHVPTGFFSLEMSGAQIVQRYICGGSHIEIKRINGGNLTEGDFRSLTTTAGKVYEYPIYVCDFPNASLFDIKLQARRMKRQMDIQCLFIDYISLISVQGQKPHWEKIMDITRELKGLARELDIPVVALSQVTRDAEGKQPSLADLRYGGSIEQDADVVLLLHRGREEAQSDLYVQKNRQGPSGKIHMFYEMKQMRFYVREET